MAVHYPDGTTRVQLNLPSDFITSFSCIVLKENSVYSAERASTRPCEGRLAEYLYFLVLTLLHFHYTLALLNHSGKGPFLIKPAVLHSGQHYIEFKTIQ